MDEQLTQQLIPFAFAKRHGIVVLNDKPDSFKVVYATMPASAVLSELTRFLPKPFSLGAADQLQFDRLLARTYESDADDALEMVERFEGEVNLASLAEEIDEAQDLLEQQDDAPVIRLLNALLSQAIKAGASDVHIETFESTLVVRFRIDGRLVEILEPPKRLSPIMASRIKVMSKLDIAEKRLPQDGRMSLKLAGRAIDVRVSVMPTHFGERIVLRLLDRESVKHELCSLGLPSAKLTQLKSLIMRPHGILLVTGPTGSGKTTSLYAMLSALNETTRNILTVEDPVEYYLTGIGQTQVNPKIDMTFAKGLRAILRQDPDVVMVGEIRDVETAKIAVQASLTGHLVFSTLHTNSAVGAITRLDDMGVEPFLLSSSLVGILAQRLVRKLCPNCKKPQVASDAECILLGIDEAKAPTIYVPGACKACSYTGYKGRSGIYELITIDEHLRSMIHERAGESVIKSYCREQFPSLHQTGVLHVLLGDTSLEELLSVCAED